jgi:hypothetical protein
MAGVDVEMVTVGDFIRVDVMHQWVVKGCNYAQVSLTRTFNRMSSPNFIDRLRRIVVGIIAEEAYLYWLQQQGVPVSLKGRTKWYEKDRYDFGVFGMKHDIKALFVKQLPSVLDVILDWFVLVPVDQFSAIPKDIYVFAFVFGSWNTIGLTHQSEEARMSHWIVHVPWDYRWTVRKDCPIGFLTVWTNSPADEGNIVRLVGTDDLKGRNIIEEDIQLSMTPVRTNHSFAELLCIQWLGVSPPNGRIVIEASDIVEEIPPKFGFKSQRKSPPELNGWYDIYLRNAVVLLVGYATKQDICEWGFIPAQSQCPPLRLTLTNNYGQKVRYLQPLSQIVLGTV